MGTFCKATLHSVLPPDTITKMQDSMFMEITNINMVREMLNSETCPYKVAWDLKTMKPQFYVTQESIGMVPIESMQDASVTNEDQVFDKVEEPIHLNTD